jgi:DNA polymerase III alpha subunit (gram-positive type)
MNELFEVYNLNIKKVLTQLEENFNSLKFSNTENDSNKIFSKISSLLNEAQKLLRNLDIEISSESQTSEYYLIVKKHRSTYNNYLKNLRKLKEKFEKENKEITLSDSNKNNLIEKNTEEIAYNSFNKLNLARRSTIEMENVGNDVMKDMNGQSIQMKNLNNKIGNVGDELVLSTNVISEMQRIQRKNKNIIIGYSIFLIVIFFIIATYRILPKFIDFSGSNHEYNPPYNNNILYNTTTNSSFFLNKL